MSHDFQTGWEEGEMNQKQKGQKDKCEYCVALQCVL